jgi:hypothetical protein
MRCRQRMGSLVVEPQEIREDALLDFASAKLGSICSGELSHRAGLLSVFAASVIRKAVE